ncbi:hypothetical protein ID866_10325 [Astraeus odoratus]|nr:hypothetical protein ID866_10325 [Astraeus odoratus]
MRAAEVQRRTVEGQCKPSIVIPVGGLLCSLGALVVHLQGSGLHVTGAQVGDPHSGAKASCSWLKAAAGATWKWRRTEAKEDNGEDDEEDDEDDGEGDFTVPPALMQEHRDMLSTLTTTLSALLKEFRGYHRKQWDLDAHQVKGLKALQREMRKANALKAKELEATTKGKEKAVDVPEESSESSKKEEETKDGHEGGVAEGEDEDRDRDVDIEMGTVPLASAT